MREWASVVGHKEQIERLAFLERARNLARSGAHADADGVRAALEGERGFVDVLRWFDDRRFKAQLDQLCALARMGGTAPRGPRGARRHREPGV